MIGRWGGAWGIRKEPKKAQNGKIVVKISSERKSHRHRLVSCHQRSPSKVGTRANNVCTVHQLHGRRSHLQYVFYTDDANVYKPITTAKERDEL